MIWLCHYSLERDFRSNHNFLDTVDETQKLKMEREKGEYVLVFHIVFYRRT